MVRAVEGGAEQAVTTFKPFRGSGAWGQSRSNYMCPWDWSPDGQGLVVGSDQFTQYQSLYLLPLGAAPHAEAVVKPLASDPKYRPVAGERFTERTMDCIRGADVARRRNVDGCGDAQYGSSVESMDARDRRA